MNVVFYAGCFLTKMEITRFENKALSVVASKENATKPAKVKRNILGEEDFVESLEKIIVRDFYPDLPRLEAQTEYLDALERNDREKLRLIHVKYGPKRGSTKTPSIYSTPSTFETPIGEGKETPHEPPDKNKPTGEGQSSEQHNEDRAEEEPTHNPEPKQKAPDTSLGLDKFLARTTSEDNAAFDEIQQQGETRYKLTHAWLFDQEQSRKQEKQDHLALPGIEQQALQGERSQELQTWTYQLKNPLMYVPEGVDDSAAEKIEKAGQCREIHHHNTRFSLNPFNLKKSRETISEAASTQAANQQGKIGVDGKEVLPKQLPNVNGYGFVATPSPAIGVEDSPMMTWGEIEGTPFRLDASDTPLVCKAKGPQFKIPEVPKRDQLAHQLAENASKAHRTKKQEALKRVTANFAATSPSFSSCSKTERLAYLSPAAQKLATARLGVRTNTDKALRASYSPSPSPSHSLTGDKTPVLTPGSRRSKSGGRTPKTPRGSTPKRTPEPVSLTDNLLQLPKRTKAQDFF